ncbi:unnamed protein product [Brassica rapa]|uniref:Auxin response factor n=1 Tax=Brassica campestris TaxID=3711 RepID=A0A8D9G5B3_BRACM|nr:unnamed protein product [Brassica rapa]
MASDQIMHVQPEFLATGGTNNYLYDQLWKLCAGPLFDPPKIGEELVTSINDELCQLKPVFNIPSKIRCNVFSIKLKVETTTDEIYAEISLLPDTSEVEIPTSKCENNIQNIKCFTKVLSASDTSKKGGFVLNKRHAIECLPPLDMSHLTPSQEINATDIHGHEWKFKHALKGTPKRHLFTSGWNEFAKAKKLVVGDSFIFLRGENGESRVGIKKAAHHQQENIPSSIISKESMHHGVVATALNAIKNKCMFVVFYKPRSSQFVVNIDKFRDGVNKKFSIGSRFLMKFEGKDFNEIRYYGTILKVRDFSTHWKDSEWRCLEVQWDEAATIPRPDKVSPWEIEPLTHSSDILKSGSNMWVPTLTQGQEVGHSSIQSSMSYSFATTMSKPNYNEQMVQAMKETSTTTATTSYRLFGVDLKVPAKTKDSIEPINSYKKSKISKIFEEEKVDHIQTRSHTKVRMEGAMERTVDLSIFDGYNQLIDELERLFDIKGKLHIHNQWKIVFINADGDIMLLGDDPWPKFCNTAKEIFICSKNDAKIGDADNKFSEVHRSSGVAGFGPPISVEVDPPVSSLPTGVSSPWVSPLVSKKVSCDATISNSHVEPYTSAPPGVASAQLQLLLEFLPMTSKLESILLVRKLGPWGGGGAFVQIPDENLDEAREEFRDILFARLHGEATDMGRNIGTVNVIWSHPDDAGMEINKNLEEPRCEAAIYSDKIAEGGYISSTSEGIGVKIDHFEIRGQDYDRSTKENPLSSKGRK